MKSSLLLLVFMLAFVGAPAQQYPLQVEPVFRNYSQDVGLPANAAYRILQDSKGYIWAATNQGVCRFNGYEFEQFPDTLYSNFNAVFGKSMTLDESGRLWFVNINWRVYYVENERVIPWKYNPQLKPFNKDGNILNGILVKGRGEEVWFGTSHSGIIHADQNGQMDILPGLESSDRVFFENKYGGLDSKNKGTSSDQYLQKLSQTLNFQGQNIEVPLFPFTKDSLTNNNFLFSSSSHLREGTWLLNAFSSYFYFENNQLVWRRKAPGKPIIWAIQDASGRILTGHNFGGGLKTYASREDFRDTRPAFSALPGLTVTCIFQDRERGYWITTQEQGVFYCASFESGRLTGLPDLDDVMATDIVGDDQSTMYAGFRNGKIFAIDVQKLIATDISPPANEFVNELTFDKTSKTLALAGAKNAFYKNGHWETIEFLETTAGQKAPWQSKDLVPGNDQDVWISVSGIGLVQANIRTKKAERSTFDMLTSKGTRRYVSARQDQSGRVWAYNIDGFVEWVGDRIDTVYKTNPIFKQYIKDIALLPDTSLVLCPLGHGLAFWKPGRALIEIKGKNGLLSDWFTTLYYHAPNSSLWAGCRRGVNKIRFDGHGGYKIETFILEHGLPNNSVSAFAVAENDLWWATEKGLYRTRNRPDTVVVPAPVFHAVSVNNVPYFPTEALVLPHDSADITIDLLSLYFRGNGKTPFAYRLLHGSGDTSWQLKAGRRISFLNLQPGKYRLEVKTQGDANAWSPVSTLDIVICPPWWAIWWARSLFALGLGLGVYSLYRYRTGQIVHESRLKEEMLRLERSALQAQMSPHFIFNCLNSIQNFILKNDSDAAVLYLARFAKLVRSSLNASVEGSVSLEEEINMLNHYLTLEQLRFKQAFEYQISVDPMLDRVHTMLPPLIVQPFVENAVLHGLKDLQKDGLILIKFYPDNGMLCVEVRDNGLGLEQEKSKTGDVSLGGSITRRRLELLNAQSTNDEISIAYSTPEGGTGTIVLIRLPLRQIPSL
ncbi:MAG: histidine kinase [Phycisphaerae bacterium]|nr:histidine kinase [Saprospiraceae bacterium]